MTDDWRSLDGPALDRLVAERLGWTEIVIVESEYGDYVSGWTESLEGIPPGETEHRHFRPVSRDAAAPLPLAEGERIVMIERHDGTFSAQAQPHLWGHFFDQDWPTMEADTLALARLRAWLARDDAKRDQEPSDG